MVEAEETHATDLTQKGVASASLGCGKPKLSTQPNTYQIPMASLTLGVAECGGQQNRPDIGQESK